MNYKLPSNRYKLKLSFSLKSQPRDLSTPQPSLMTRLIDFFSGWLPEKVVLPPQLKDYDYSVEKGLIPRPPKSWKPMLLLISMFSLLPMMWGLNNKTNASLLTTPNLTHVYTNSKHVVKELSLPTMSATRLYNVSEETPSQQLEKEGWVNMTVQPGDTLSEMFERHGLSKAQLYQMLAINKDVNKKLQNLRPYQEIKIRKDKQGTILELVFILDFFNELHISYAEGQYQAQISEREIETHIVSKYGYVEDTLFNSGKKAGLSDRMIAEMAAVFRWDLDFRDFPENDYFSVLYENHHYQGEDKPGHIVAIEFVNDGEVYQAIRYTNEKGETDYYKSNGELLFKKIEKKQKQSVDKKKINALLIPVKYQRISSPFGMRKHPILNRMRFHSGVDYVAPSGTPIIAAADATVEFRGYQRGYGRTVVLRHGKHHTTLYAHMSGFAEPKVGDTVKRGETIGFVGQSGMSTGPHLHFEFRVDGEPQNPIQAELSPELYAKQLAEQKKRLAEKKRQEEARKARFLAETKEIRQLLAKTSLLARSAVPVDFASSLAKAAGATAKH